MTKATPTQPLHISQRASISASSISYYWEVWEIYLGGCSYLGSFWSDEELIAFLRLNTEDRREEVRKRHEKKKSSVLSIEDIDISI